MSVEHTDSVSELIFSWSNILQCWYDLSLYSALVILIQHWTALFMQRYIEIMCKSKIVLNIKHWQYYLQN
jgi:hypothetical protein